MAMGSGGATLRERGYRMMDAVEYQIWRNRMCMEYSQNAGCEGRCPLAGLCTPEDGQGHEEEAVRAVECYRTKKEPYGANTRVRVHPEDAWQTV